MMNFDEFAAEARHALTQLVTDLHGERDPSPMVLMDTPEGIRMVAVDAEFFHPDYPERRRELVSRFVLPMVGEHGAQTVALAYAGWLHRQAPEDLDREEVISITVIDREVHRTWYAPLVRDPQPPPGSDQHFTVGMWESWPANKQTGIFVTPIQHALR